MTSEAQILSGLRVVDGAVGMAGALVTKFLRELGAEAYRAPPGGVDPFFDVYPAYGAWRDQVALAADADLDRLLAEVDVCLVGGEAFAGLPPVRDAAALSAQFPRLIVVEITGAPAGMPPMPAVDILAQARSGLVFELREGDPALSAFQPSSYGAMFQALIAIGAALRARETTGCGQVISVSLLGGVLTWAQPMWTSAERPTPGFLFEQPKAARPIILRCRDGVYIHLVLGALGSKGKLYAILGIDDPSVKPDDAGRPNPSNPPEKFFGDVDFLQTYVGQRDSEELLPALWAAGLVVERVLAPGACWDEEQVRLNGVVARASDGTQHMGAPGVCTLTAGPPKALGAPTGDAPLSGVRVVDFGAYVAGPMASTPLADLGAEVIKVEPFEGDALRPLPRFFLSANRGKRGIVLDLKVPNGLEIAQRLCAAADVVCSNFRIGVAARLGIDGAALHAKRPELIVVNNTGYGLTGPKASNSAFDPAMQAATGHEMRAGGVGNPPFLNRLSMIDVAGGLLSAALTSLALYNRARRGQGVDITTPLFSAGMFLLSELVRGPDGAFAGAEPLDADAGGYHPAEKLYAVRDGWISVAARDDAAAGALGAALGVADRLPVLRADWRPQEGAVLKAALAGLTSEEALDRLRSHDVWAEPCIVDGGARALQDPVLVASGNVYRATDPDYGEIRGLGPQVAFSAAQAGVARLAPRQGEHTREVLLELGYTADEVAGLLSTGVVR